MKPLPKELLLKENARLREQLDVLDRKDRELRENLTAILRYYSRSDMYGSKPTTMTWLDIAFYMGELRADANYSMLLESREALRNEIEALKAPKP